MSRDLLGLEAIGALPRGALSAARARYAPSAPAAPPGSTVPSPSFSRSSTPFRATTMATPPAQAPFRATTMAPPSSAAAPADRKAKAKAQAMRAAAAANDAKRKLAAQKSARAAAARLRDTVNRAKSQAAKFRKSAPGYSATLSAFAVAAQHKLSNTKIVGGFARDPFHGIIGELVSPDDGFDLASQSPFLFQSLQTVDLAALAQAAADLNGLSNQGDQLINQGDNLANGAPTLSPPPPPVPPPVPPPPTNDSSLPGGGGGDTFPGGGGGSSDGGGDSGGGDTFSDSGGGGSGGDGGGAAGEIESSADGGDGSDSDQGVDDGGALPDEAGDQAEADMEAAPYEDDSDLFSDVVEELVGGSRRRILGVDIIPKAGQQYTDHDTVLAVQQALQAKGFNPGPLDGVMGPKTGKAIRLMQVAAGLPETGVVDEGVLMALRVRAGGSARGSSSPALATTSVPTVSSAATQKVLSYFQKPLWTGSPIKIWQATVGAAAAVVLSSVLFGVTRRRS